MSTLGFDNQRRPRKPLLPAHLHTKLFNCRHIYTDPWSRQNPTTGWPKEPPGMQSRHPRVALGQLWQDSCVGAVFCQTNPSQAHFWNMGSRKVNLQLKCRSALNLSGSNILQLDGCTICADLSQWGSMCTEIPNQNMHFERKVILVCWCNAFIQIQKPPETFFSLFTCKLEVI